MLSQELSRQFRESLRKGAAGSSRGELWLGTDVLSDAGISDTVEGHLRFAEGLGHSILCLPVSDKAEQRGPGYSYFGPDDLRKASETSSLPLFAVVDGPFQRLADRLGLMTLLVEWLEDREELFAAYAAEAGTVLELLAQVAGCRVRAVVIADDLSSDQGPLVRPADAEAVFSGFYREAVRTINASGAAAFLHSCGKLEKWLPVIRTWGLDGMAAIQSGVNDLAGLRAALDADVTVLGGIELELLEAASPSASQTEGFLGLVQALGPTGQLILGTSCGLYRPELMPRLAALYELAESRLRAGGRDGA